jgi:hypothetical protein
MMPNAFNHQLNYCHCGKVVLSDEWQVIILPNFQWQGCNECLKKALKEDPQTAYRRALWHARHALTRPVTIAEIDETVNLITSLIGLP